MLPDETTPLAEPLRYFATLECNGSSRNQRSLGSKMWEFAFRRKELKKEREAEAKAQKCKNSSNNVYRN